MSRLSPHTPQPLRLLPWLLRSHVLSFSPCALLAYRVSHCSPTFESRAHSKGILGTHGENGRIGISEFTWLANVRAKAADDILLTETWWERLVRECCGLPVCI